MSVLVDKSVWSDHFRRTNNTLVELLEFDQVLGHPLVVGELACGAPPEPRRETLKDMDLLLAANQASTGDIRELIEREQLFCLGCGWVDMALLASTLITPGALLWTLDRRLSGLAGRFGVRFSPALL